MAQIGSLTIEIRAVLDKFQADMKAAKKEADAFAKTLKPIQQQAKDIGLAMTAVGGAVVGTLVAMTKQAANYGDAIRDASIRTGATTEQLSGLKYAAEQTGTSFETLTTGMKFLAKNAAEGSSAFKGLGVNVKDTATGSIRPINDILLDVSDKLSKMQDGAEKSTLMMKLMGRGAVDLTEFMNLGRDSISGFIEEAERMGIIMGPDAVAMADTFNDSLKQMNTAMLGLSIVIGSQLMPPMIDLMTTVVNGIVQVKDFVEEHRHWIDAVFDLGVVVGVGGVVMLGLAGMLTILPKLQAAWAALNLIIAANPFIFVATAVLTLVAAFYTMRYEIAGGVAKAWAFLLTGLADIADAVHRVAGALGMTGMASALSAAGNSIRNTAKNLSDMGSVLLAGEPKILDNTKLIENFEKAHRGAAGAIGATKEEQEKLKKTMEDAYSHLMDLEERQRDSRELTQTRLKETMEASYKKVVDLGTQRHDIAKINQEDLRDQMERDYARYIELEEQRKASILNSQDELKAAMEKEYGEFVDIEKQRIRKTQMDIDERVKAEKKANDEIREAAGHVFDDMFLKGQSVFSSLINMLKGGALSLGRAIFQDISATLLGPIKKAFNDFFSGAIGKMLGGAGGAAAGGVAAAGGGAAAGTAGAGGSAALVGLATNPITIAIAGAVAAAIGIVKSQAHWEANTLIKTVHDPFVESVKKIHDTFFEAAAVGDLTADAAKDARKDLQDLWDSLKEQAAAFAKGGSDEAKVVEQMFSRFTEVWGPDLQKIFENMDAVIAGMPETLQEMAEAAHEAFLKINKDEEERISNLLALLTVQKDIEDELADVQQKAVDAIIAKLDFLDSAIEESQSKIQGWRDQITDINERINENTRTMVDATHWTDVYNDAIRETGDELKRATDRRKSIEEQIASLEKATQRDALVAAADAEKEAGKSMEKFVRTTKEGINAFGHKFTSVMETNIPGGQGASGAAQKALEEFDKAQKQAEVDSRIQQLQDLKIQLGQAVEAERQATIAHQDARVAAGELVAAEKERLQAQIDADFALRKSLGENIRLEQEHIANMEADREATARLFDAINGVRQTEFDRINGTIGALIARGVALENERSALVSLTGQIQASADTFNDISSRMNAGPSLPSAQVAPPVLAVGTPRVERSGMAWLDQGESVVPAGKGGGITVNITVQGSVTSEKDLVRTITEAIDKHVKYGGGNLTSQGVRR